MREYASLRAGQWGKFGLKSGNPETPGHDASSGVPSDLHRNTQHPVTERPVKRTPSSRNHLKIRKSSSISLSPCQSARRFTISTKIVPMDHMSTAGAYVR